MSLALFGGALDGAAGQEWTVAGHFEIRGAAVLSDSAFSSVGSVRVARDGRRVVVSEPLVPRVTIWTADGDLVREVETASIATPTGLGTPLGVEEDSPGFQVRYRHHFLGFTWDGELREVLDAPAGLSPVVALPDNRFFSLTELPSVRVLLGWTEQQLPALQAVLHIGRSGHGWTKDTVAILDKRNGALGMRLDDDSTYPAATFARQPFGDFDLTFFDRIARRVGVLRRNLGPGRIEILELTVEGDTTWHRRLELPVVPMSMNLRQEAVERFAQQALTASQRRGSPLTATDARNLAEQALHLPKHLVPAAALVATTSNEVWIRSAEGLTGVSVWYSLTRGDHQSAPRRVLIPNNFVLKDATPTHVWGVRTDPSTSVGHVVGMRLIEPRGQGR